jgi:hypothetical protein
VLLVAPRSALITTRMCGKSVLLVYCCTVYVITVLWCSVYATNYFVTVYVMIDADLRRQKTLQCVNIVRQDPFH